MKRDMSQPPDDCEILSIQYRSGAKRTPTEFLADHAVPAIEIRRYADGTVWESRSKFDCWGGYIPAGWVCVHDPRPPLEGPDECTLQDCYDTFGENATNRVFSQRREHPFYKPITSPLQLFNALLWLGDNYHYNWRSKKTGAQ